MASTQIGSELSARMTTVLENQRRAFRANPPAAAAERRAGLKRLLRAVLERKDQIVAAVNEDFGCRSAQETLFAEIYTTVSAIRHARGHLRSWMRPQRRPVPLTLFPAEAWVEPQPVGVVGIISPWNFPVNLALVPLVGALAAGNRVMIKPSEYTPATAEMLRTLIADAFNEDEVAVITGDAEVGRVFSSLPFDHLLFTGSTAVGREVMKAAAANLTPVTLELGGKSPALIAPDADLRGAAASLAFGKLTNAGQICIAPDYVLVARAGLRDFIGEFQAAAVKAFPGGVESAEYTAIIHDRHYRRLQGYLEEASSRGVEVIWPLGPAVAAPKKLPPALLIDPPLDLGIMQEEIFGPLLPVRPYDSFQEAVDFIRDRPRPLVIYLFSTNPRVELFVAERTVSGGLCVNDALIHVAVDELPFGGIGPSGMGCYHGRDGFNTFSHLKPVYRTRWYNPTVVFRPPATALQRRIGRWLIGR